MTTQPVLTSREKTAIFLYLIPYLITHGPTSLTQLAAQFAVNEVTIERMVRFIPTTGAPGESGTYLHQDLYDIDWELLDDAGVVHLTQVVGLDAPLRFTATQQAALISGLTTLAPTLNADEQAVARRAVDKLAQATSSGVPQFEVAHTPEPGSDALQFFAAAARNRHVIEFEYRDHQGNTTERTVTPHRVLHQRGNWYLEGWCHTRNAARLFLVASTADARISDVAPATLAEPANTDTVTEQHGNSYELRVHVRVAPHAVHQLTGWNPQFTDTGPDGHVEAQIDLFRLDRVIDLVCLAPGDIEVLAPDQARATVREWAQQMRVE